jgi:2,3,4,5-tetrahydropyridine-2,6-dicarboxylate N-succinyltransferase
LIGGGAVGPWWDKVPNKFDGWEAPQFEAAGFRAVPGSIVRRGAYVGKNVILMPSFVNIGAYVDDSTMVDTWVTVGSCAQIGKRVHLSGGVGIGGVLEPLQANPTIIEDDCFIGARSEVVEGVVIGEGSVLSMGVFISASTKIVDRATGQVHIGKVPPYSVVVPGSLPDKNGGPSLSCAVIVKTVDAKTRSKTSINEGSAARLIRRPVLVPVEVLPRPRDHVDVGIGAGVLVGPARAHLQQHRLAVRAVLQVVAVGDAGLEARAVAGPQHVSPPSSTSTTSPSTTQTNSSSAECQWRWLLHWPGGRRIRLTPNWSRPAASPRAQRRRPWQGASWGGG